MRANDLHRLQALFDVAVDLPAVERAAFVDAECAGEPELARALSALLATDERLTHMTIRPIGPTAQQILDSRIAPSLTGQRVGAFELREELGHGGMGRVYRAERVDSGVSQQVAIKFVRRELLDAGTSRRFQLERQLLATLDHPNIARLIDAAELPDGTPYYVMELVDGVPITTYCEREWLGVRERVLLLRTVCGAVTAAHRGLIVHRDIKPGNVLVGSGGVPKLLDFGIARPLEPHGGAAGEATGTAQRYFSPAYAAPEQLTGAPAGVACDVYALGLLLYELLAGCRPFDFTNLSAAQVERVLLTVPPVAPSAIVARRPGGHAHGAARQIAGDLDGIVLRCLRKAPGERYGSVEQLDADLGNYLEGRPVQARGGHAWYRVHKFVRRNVAPISAAGLVALAAASGLVAFASQARIAQQRARELEQVSSFQADMLERIDPHRTGALLGAAIDAKLAAALEESDLTGARRDRELRSFRRNWQRMNVTDAARDVIDATVLAPAARTIDEHVTDSPAVEATLRQVLASRYTALGRYDAAAPLQERALAIRREVLGNDDPETLRSIDALAGLRLNQGERRAAEQLLVEAVAGRRRVLGDTHPDTLASIDSLATLHNLQGQWAAAEALYREALQGRRRVLGATHPETLSTLSWLSDLLVGQGRLDEAQRYVDEALRNAGAATNESDVVSLLVVREALLVQQGRRDEAETLQREIVERLRRLHGDDHPRTVNALQNLAFGLKVQGRLAEAETLFRDVLLRSRRLLGAAHGNTIQAGRLLGEVLLAEGRLAEAVPFAEQAYRDARGADDFWAVLHATGTLGKMRREQGRLDEAERLVREAFEKTRAHLGDDRPMTVHYGVELGRVLQRRGRADETVELLGGLEHAARDAPADAHAPLPPLLLVLGKARAQAGDLAGAERNLLEAQELLASRSTSSDDARECRESLVELYTAWHAQEPGGDHERNAAHWRQAGGAAPAPVAAQPRGR